MATKRKAKTQRIPLMLGEKRKFDLVPWCFWPGGEAANPDEKHPGKARE